jgi:hypothetical protein
MAELLYSWLRLFYRKVLASSSIPRGVLVMLFGLWILACLFAAGWFVYTLALNPTVVKPNQSVILVISCVFLASAVGYAGIGTASLVNILRSGVTLKKEYFKTEDLGWGIIRQTTYVVLPCLRHSEPGRFYGETMKYILQLVWIVAVNCLIAYLFFCWNRGLSERPLAASLDPTLSHNRGTGAGSGGAVGGGGGRGGATRGWCPAAGGPRFRQSARGSGGWTGPESGAHGGCACPVPTGARAGPLLPRLSRRPC